MNTVIIYKLDNDGKQNEICSFIFSKNKVSSSGDSNFIKYIEKNGISDYLSGTETKLYPSDGVKFLENLKYNFNSGYINAVESENQ